MIVYYFSNFLVFLFWYLETFNSSLCPFSSRRSSIALTEVFIAFETFERLDSTGFAFQPLYHCQTARNFSYLLGYCLWNFSNYSCLSLVSNLASLDFQSLPQLIFDFKGMSGHFHLLRGPGFQFYFYFPELAQVQATQVNLHSYGFQVGILSASSLPKISLTMRLTRQHYLQISSWHLPRRRDPSFLLWF